MWELTTGCKPFANVKHDHTLIYEIIDGKRPEITHDTPEFFANLMKSCWDPDPSKRSFIGEINGLLDRWHFMEENVEQLERSEKKRMELIQSKKLGPEFSEKHHPEAIFTNRTLSPFISKYSSINSSLAILSNTNQGTVHTVFELF